MAAASTVSPSVPKGATEIPPAKPEFKVVNQRPAKYVYWDSGDVIICVPEFGPYRFNHEGVLTVCFDGEARALAAGSSRNHRNWNAMIEKMWNDGESLELSIVLLSGKSYQTCKDRLYPALLCVNHTGSAAAIWWVRDARGNIHDSVASEIHYVRPLIALERPAIEWGLDRCDCKQPEHLLKSIMKRENGHHFELVAPVISADSKKRSTEAASLDGTASASASASSSPPTTSGTDEKDDESDDCVVIGATTKRRKHNTLAETNICTVCLDKPYDTLFFPCTHVCVCQPCATKLTSTTKLCPVCRAHIASSLAVKLT